MSYATLEEAWGPDFSIKKKKSKKEKRLEKLEKKIEKSIDPEIVIPKMADTRKTYRENIPDFKSQLDSFSGYDMYSSNFGSPFKPGTDGLGVTNSQILDNNKILENTYNREIQDKSPQDILPTQPTSTRMEKNPVNRDQLESQIGVEATKELEKIFNSSMYNKNQLVKQVEAFANQSDEQFNQLLLYIFTGIFYLFMLDMMYQLGKKSY